MIVDFILKIVHQNAIIIIEIAEQLHKVEVEDIERLVCLSQSVVFTLRLSILIQFIVYFFQMIK